MPAAVEAMSTHEPPASAHEGLSPRPGRGTHYLWLSLATTLVVVVGFSATYFGPMSAGQYPEVSPTVHVHGWTFFLWYLLLPIQAGLVVRRRVSVHRTLGYASAALAVAMVATGLVVIGVQMEAAVQPEGSPFWKALGPTIFSGLVLFAVFYTLALRYRRTRGLHKRFMLLASTGALGAAGFRVMGQLIGFGIAAGVWGIFLPNLIIVAAIGIEVIRGEGIHPVYRWGLVASLVVTGGVMLITPTAVGRVMSEGLAGLGAALAPLY